MTLNTNWLKVTNKEGIKYLEDSEKDFNLAILLCALEVPVINERTLEEVTFRFNLYNHLSGVNYGVADFEMFLGYSCNGTYQTRTKWVNRMMKLHAPKPLPKKEVFRD
tara:strand:+ start:20 stop:343 length:324 start_codon:yes stop_codon:yes gene_type:complete